MNPKHLKDPKAVKAAFTNLLNDFTEEELLERKPPANYPMQG